MTAWLMLLALAGAVGYFCMPHSPDRSWALREWLYVLRVRFANRSLRSHERGDEDDDVEVVTHADGVFASYEAASQHVEMPARPLSRGELHQIGTPGFRNPPVRPEASTTRSRVAAWIRHARETTSLTDAQIKKEAARRFDVSLRLAQLAAKDAGGRRR